MTGKGAEMIPLTRELARCTWPDGGCGRPILWAITARGARQALDPRPVVDGPVAAYRTAPRTWSARSLQAAGADRLAPHEHRFAPHVMTCPKVVAEAAAEQGEIPGLLPGARVVSIVEARRRRRAG